MKSMMKNFDANIDVNLILAYQAGNKNVLTQIVKRWHVEFCRLAYWYSKDKDTAKDIAQESWVVVFNKLDTLKEPQKFKSWAISIVNRKAIDSLRKGNREHHKLHKFYETIPKNKVLEEDESISESLIRRMKHEIEKLPQHQQTVLKLFYIEEYSLKQISSLLEISVGTAKSRLFHAREKLKTTLKTKK